MPADQVPLNIDQIEAIVLDCQSFAQLEKHTVSDRNIWSLTDAHGNSFYIHNNARRIFEIITLLNMCDRSGCRSANGERPMLLEVGINYGEVVLSVVKAFPLFEVCGLEHPDREFLKDDSYLARMRDAGIKLITSDMDNGMLPFSDSMFDVVLFCEVLEHLSPIKVPQIIAELSRIVKPNGAVIITSPNLVSFLNRLVFLKGSSIFTPAIPLHYAGGTFGHIRLYTVQELEGIASRSGLYMKHVRYNNALLINGSEIRLHTIIVKKLQIILSPFFPSLSNGWSVLFSK